MIEMEDVLVAKIVSGLVSAASSPNMRCLTSRFSETALGAHSMNLKEKVGLPAHLDDHVDIS